MSKLFETRLHLRVVMLESLTKSIEGGCEFLKEDDSRLLVPLHLGETVGAGDRRPLLSLLVAVDEPPLIDA